MIAVDAMGGDFAPRSSVYGALQAARKKIPVQLFGDESHIVALLDDAYHRWRTLPISVVHCTESIEMSDEPVQAVVRKKDSSLVQAFKAVAAGKASAVVSAGNSGAALVAGSLILKKVPGLLRPAIGDFLPTQQGKIFCLDLGANVDCKPEYLLQFALMGSAYVSVVEGIDTPRVALLSNGAEPAKGSRLVKQTHEVLAKSTLNFVGNVEPSEMFNGHVDVLVCDGFAGNIMLKAIEGTAQAITTWLRHGYNQSIWTKIAGIFNKFVLRGLKKKIDYAQKGGALLLGLQHPCIIAHGCSDDRAMFHAIEYAYQVVNNNRVGAFNAKLSDLLSDHVQIHNQLVNQGLHSEVTL